MAFSNESWWAWPFNTKEDAPAPAPAQVPQIEPAETTIANADEQARKATQARLKASRRSQSVYSSPLGLAGEASTARKSLLGQ